MLSEPAALLAFTLLFMVYILLYFGGDTSYLALKLSVIGTTVLNVSFH